jgi:predicted dehydrogenase
MRVTALGEIVVRLGIVGCNFGRAVQLPAFRTDPRCEVVALAGSDAARTQALAAEAGVRWGYGDWQALVENAGIDAIAIAVPPRLQPEIAMFALKLGKPVFVEKPMAAELAGAQAMARAQAASGCATSIDFNFTGIAAWREAKRRLDDGAIGRLRHVVVTWNVENKATQLRLHSWKTGRDQGGGVLGNFVSHSLYYLEWFCGPATGLSAKLFGLPDDPALLTTTNFAFSFASGAAGSLAVSCAAFAGSGHRIELYGEDGALVLSNTTADYMRGFTLAQARRPNGFEPIMVADPLDAGQPDGRIAPTARLASGFLDAIERGTEAHPGFREGLRVQRLMDAAQRSDAQGAWTEVTE